MSLTAELFGSSAKVGSIAGASKPATENVPSPSGIKFAAPVDADALFRKVEVKTLVAKAREAVATGAGAAEKRRKKHLSHARDPVEGDELRRTIFVSNLPNAIEGKDVKKHFASCGPIESVRVRCIHLKTLHGEKDRGRAVRILRKEIDEDPRHSSTAYIVFENPSSVDAALAMSGCLFKGRHLSVGREESDGKAFLPKFSVFLGNLSYDVSDEEVWQYFLERNIKDVDRVRVIRDKETGVARGIGYVSFRSSGSVQRAIEVREQDLKGRPLRIAHVQKPKDPKLVVQTATRREKRRLLHQKAVMENSPQLEVKAGKKLSKKAKAAEDREGEQKTSGRRQEAQALGIQEAPSWMGVVTNPRKKLAAELRVLTQSDAERKKRITEKRKEAQQRVRDSRKRTTKAGASGAAEKKKAK